MDSSGKKKDFMITYKENPFNPFTQFDDWYGFDMAYGRHIHEGFDIYGLIARECPSSDENLTDYENEELLNEAINIVMDKYETKYRLVLMFEDETVEEMIARTSK